MSDTERVIRPVLYVVDVDHLRGAVALNDAGEVDLDETARLVRLIEIAELRDARSGRRLRR